MITKLYWASRILGYLACLAGIFLFLTHKADAEQALAQTGLGLVGIGFFAFFASYGLRAWMRFGRSQPTDKE